MCERWLRAPLQRPDGTLERRDRGTPQGSAVSPVLANLFMHYAFDMWMARKFPSVPFERYVDDAVVHCVSEKQALMMRDAIAERLAEVGLTLHPEKTKVVYCQDWNRRTRSYEHTSVTFLGYEFRARTARDRNGAHVRLVSARDQQGGREADQPRGSRLAFASAHRLVPGPARTVDQSDRAGLVAVLRPVLPVETVCAVQTHQHLSDAMGPQEIPAVTWVQESPRVVESLGRALPSAVRALGVHPWFHGGWMVGAV